MNKGVIIYIGPFQLPDKNAAAFRVISNGKILRELGYNVVFIDIDKSAESNLDILKTKKATQGFEYWSYAFPKSVPEWYKYIVSIEKYKSVIKQFTNIKAIIAYNFKSLALYKVFKYYRKKGIKVIADCTEWYSIKDRRLFYKPYIGIDTFIRMRIIHKKLDGLIVISAFLLEYYKKHLNVIRIPPLVDIAEKKWITTTNKTNSEVIRFVYSGFPGKNKDKINLIVEAFHELKDSYNYVFKIVGISFEQYISYYPRHRNLISDLGNHVEFVGKLSHEDSINLLKAADYSIFFREDNIVSKAGFPTKLVESISCKVPVITNDTSDIGDLIVSMNNGIIIKDDLTSVLEMLLKTPEISIKLKENINKNQFDYHKFVDATQKFLNKIGI